jgi:hypothetical protein
VKRFIKRLEDSIRALPYHLEVSADFLVFKLIDKKYPFSKSSGEPDFQCQ